MKKYFLGAVLTVSLFSSQLVQADVLPEGQKNVPVCAVIGGIAALPKLTIFTREINPNLDVISVQTPKEGDCIDVSYKFNILELYAVDASYGATVLQKMPNYDPGNDPRAYKANLQVDVKDQLIDLTSKLEYVHNEYSIAGVDNQKHQLVLVFVASQSNEMIADAFPKKPTGVDDHIQFSSKIFNDVAPGSIYYDATSYLKSLGIVSGYTDGSFKSTAHTNRVEFTKMVVSALNGLPNNTYHDNDGNILCFENLKNPDGTYRNLYTDIPGPKQNGPDPWYLDTVCYSKEHSLVDGYVDGSFRPNDDINFAEAAKILAKAFKLSPPTTSGESSLILQPWYYAPVMSLASRKAIPTTVKSFNQKITRGEMAEMIYRLKAGKTDLKSQTYANLD